MIQISTKGLDSVILVPKLTLATPSELRGSLPYIFRAVAAIPNWDSADKSYRRRRGLPVGRAAAYLNLPGDKSPAKPLPICANWKE